MKVVLVLLSLIIASPSWALLIVGGANNGTDVGSLDSIIGATSNLQESGNGCPNGSQPAAEECWAETLTGITDLVYSGVKNGPVAVNFTDQAGVIAFSLASGPGFYIVKNSQTWILLENLASNMWGVLDTTSSSLSGLQLNLGKDDQVTISHVTEFDSSTHVIEVPEPGTFGLLGLGLIGLGLARWKRSIA